MVLTSQEQAFLFTVLLLVERHLNDDKNEGRECGMKRKGKQEEDGITTRSPDHNRRDNNDNTEVASKRPDNRQMQRTAACMPRRACARRSLHPKEIQKMRELH
jgi:hypothetical protein